MPTYLRTAEFVERFAEVCDALQPQGVFGPAGSRFAEITKLCDALRLYADFHAGVKLAKCKTPAELVRRFIEVIERREEQIRASDLLYTDLQQIVKVMAHCSKNWVGRDLLRGKTFGGIGPDAGIINNKGGSS